MLQIPLQYPVHTGMIERTERPTGPAHQGAERGNLGRRQVVLAAHRPAGQEGNDPGVQRLAIGVGDFGDRVDAGRFYVRGRSDAGVGQEPRGRILSLDLDPGEHRVGDLEYSDGIALRGVEQEVCILLAPQWRDNSLEPEMRLGNVYGVRRCYRWCRQILGLEEVEQWH